MYRKLLLGIGAIGVMCAANGSVALARTVSASSGHALVGADMTCFNYQPVTGNAQGCSAGTKKFIVPLTVDTAGVKTVTFSSRSNAAGSGQCRVLSNSQNGTAPVANAFVAIPQSGSFVSQSLGSINVPANGILFAECDMNLDARVNSFTYAG